MTEDQLEQETLGWLSEVGYAHLYGPDIAYDGDNPERESYRDVLLTMRLRTAIARLNPQVPLAAREDALRQVLELGCRCSCRPIACSIVCWSAVCRCNTRRTVRPAVISCG